MRHHAPGSDGPRAGPHSRDRSRRVRPSLLGAPDGSMIRSGTPVTDPARVGPSVTPWHAGSGPRLDVGPRWPRGSGCPAPRPVRAALLDALEVPVDQRPDRQEQLAQRLRELLLELAELGRGPSEAGGREARVTRAAGVAGSPGPASRTEAASGRRRVRAGFFFFFFKKRVRLGRRRVSAWAAAPAVRLSRGLRDKPLSDIRCLLEPLLDPAQGVVGRAPRRSRPAADQFPRLVCSIERHLEGPVLEGGAGRLQLRERGGEHDRPALAVDADDQLEADLLQRDLALARER